MILLFMYVLTHALIGAIIMRKLYGFGYDAYFITVKIVRTLDKTNYNNKEFVIEDIMEDGYRL